MDPEWIDIDPGKAYAGHLASYIYVPCLNNLFREFCYDMPSIGDDLAYQTCSLANGTVWREILHTIF